jgi:SPP1 family predicted phage head-tail adaptor
VTRPLRLDPGVLRNELRIEAPAVAPDGMGGAIETWVEAGVLFGRIEPLSARQTFEGGQDIERVTHRIVTRRSPALASGRRLRLNQRIFRIITVSDPDETGRYAASIVEELP